MRLVNKGSSGGATTTLGWEDGGATGLLGNARLGVGTVVERLGTPIVGTKGVVGFRAGVRAGVVVEVIVLV